MAGDGDFRVLVASNQEAAMMEIGEGVRPPEVPPDKNRPESWVQLVKGSGKGRRPIPEEMMDDEFVTARLCLEFPDGENGTPVITIGKEVLETMNGLWKNCMIVKVLGRNVSLPFLNKRLMELWKPSGSMHVMDLPRQFFMIRFEKEEEYLAALVGGPWRVFGSLLVVRAWSPEFDALKDEITTTPVWVRLMNIPVKFYHKAILMGIAKGWGKPVKVDETTLQFERARFARVCVEIDLTKPLKGMVLVNGEKYFVAYEGMTNICSSCGLYGHLIHNCPKKVQEREVALEMRNLNMRETSNVEAQGEEGFTVVRNQSRRSGSQQTRNGPIVRNVRGQFGRNNQGSKPRKGLENIPVSNVFGRLGENLGSSVVEEEVMMTEVNKENINVNQGGMGKNGGEGNKVVFTAVASDGKSGNRKVGEDKKTGERKGVVKNSPMTRQNQGKASGGLVFGNTNEEMVLSNTGKRLRVETKNVGRPGGSFTSGSVETSKSMNHLKNQGEETESGQRKPSVGQPREEIDMQSEPSSRETEMIAA